MKVKMIRFFAAVTALTLCVSGLAGCKTKPVQDDDQHLEIYVLNVGYGHEFVPALAQAFGELDWVKEKYPSYSYSYKFNDDWDYARDQIKQGPTVNTADVLFGDNVQRLYETMYKNQPVLTDLDGIMQETVMGEDVKYIDKIYSDYIPINTDPNTGHMIAVPWGMSLSSLLYNETVFNALNVGELPVTTDGFVEVLKAVKAKNGQDSAYKYSWALTGCDAVNYWKNAFTYWWAQYQGLEEYQNFYRLASEGKISRSVFEQQGRLKALTAMEEILSGANGYINPSTGSYNFMSAQTNFLMGNGIFYMCGDWFDYEMRAHIPGLQAQGYDYDFRIMRMPMLSSVREGTSIPSDEKLADLIRLIDAGKTAEDAEVLATGATKADFNKIKTARALADFGGGQLNGCIPSYATAKNLAMDFLRWLATDDANRIYAEVTKGASMGFIYDLEADAPEVYAKIAQMERDKFELLKSEDVKFLPSYDSFPTVYKGTLMPLQAIQYKSYETVFGRTDDGFQSAAELYQYDIDYYANDSRWTLLLNMSDIQM